jgi:hypothetical protein
LFGYIAAVVIALALLLDTVAVELDFVNPAHSGWHLLDRGGQGRFDEAGEGRLDADGRQFSTLGRH